MKKITSEGDKFVKRESLTVNREPLKVKREKLKVKSLALSGNESEYSEWVGILGMSRNTRNMMELDEVRWS